MADVATSAFSSAHIYDQLLVWFLIPLILLLLWSRNIFAHRKDCDVARIPMPGGSSYIWGHEKIVMDDTAGMAHMKWFLELRSSVIRIRGAFQMPDILVVGDPLAVAHIMDRKVYDYHHSAVVRPRMARLLGRSLVWVEGEAEHRRMRALFTSALSVSELRSATSSFLSVGNKICDELLLEYEYSSNGMQVNILDWVGRATLQMIGQFGFRHDFLEGRDGVTILKTWRKMATMGMSRRGILALLFLRRFSILNYLPLKAMKEQGRVRFTIHDIVKNKIVRYFKDSGTNLDDQDMLSQLLSAHSEGKIPMSELLDHIVLFIMAGSETTSQTLAYAIWELSRNPEIQERLREEIYMTSEAEPTFDDLQNKFPYLDAILRETIRLHPVVPYMERVATKDDILPLRHVIESQDGSKLTHIRIKTGQTIIFPVHYMNRVDTIWGDGQKYRPERWLQPLPHLDLLPKGWSNTMTFSSGPRSCVGYRLAIVQFKAVLFCLTRRFRFIDTGAVLTHKVTSTMQPHPLGKADNGPNMPVRLQGL